MSKLQLLNPAKCETPAEKLKLLHEMVEAAARRGHIVTALHVYEVSDGKSIETVVMADPDSKSLIRGMAEFAFLKSAPPELGE